VSARAHARRCERVAQREGAEERTAGTHRVLPGYLQAAAAREFFAMELKRSVLVVPSDTEYSRTLLGGPSAVHTYTSNQTQTNTHACTRTRARMHAEVDTQTHSLTETHAQKHRHTHARAHTNANKLKPPHTAAHTLVVQARGLALEYPTGSRAQAPRNPKYPPVLRPSGCCGRTLPVLQQQARYATLRWGLCSRHGLHCVRLREGKARCPERRQPARGSRKGYCEYCIARPAHAALQSSEPRHAAFTTAPAAIRCDAMRCTPGYAGFSGGTHLPRLRRVEARERVELREAFQPKLSKGRIESNRSVSSAAVCLARRSPDRAGGCAR
jgi:hypothetical protein